MKKLFLSALISLSTLAGFSQDIGIKLAGVTTFTVIPAHTQNADSIAILSVDRTYTGTVNGIKEGKVVANIQFWKNNKPQEIMALKLWDTFQSYADITDAKIIARVKNKLNIP